MNLNFLDVPDHDAVPAPSSIDVTQNLSGVGDLQDVIGRVGGEDALQRQARVSKELLKLVAHILNDLQRERKL